MDLSIGLEGPPERVDVAATLKAFGVGATSEDVKFLQRVAERHDDISAWLSKNPEAMQGFKSSPLAVIAKQYPELEVPKTRITRIPGSVAGRVTFVFEPPTPAAELLTRITTWVAAAPANADEFHADPFAVVTAQSTGYSAAVVEEVRNAIGTVLGMPSFLHILDIADDVRLGRI